MNRRRLFKSMGALLAVVPAVAVGAVVAPGETAAARPVVPPGDVHLDSYWKGWDDGVQREAIDARIERELALAERGYATWADVMETRCREPWVSGEGRDYNRISKTPDNVAITGHLTSATGPFRVWSDGGYTKVELNHA